MKLPKTPNPKGRLSNRNSQDALTKSNYIPELPKELSQAYRDFNASLTPAQRAALNIHSDANPTGEVRPLHKSDDCARIENLDEPTTLADLRNNLFTAPLESLADTQEEAANHPPSGYLHIIAVLAILRRVLRVYEVSGQQDQAVRLHGECIALALGIPGFRQSEVARTYGVTKQAVNKRVRVIAQALELPPAYRTPLASLPRLAGVSLKGSTHPHPSKASQAKVRGQQCHARAKHPTPPHSRGASKPEK